MDQETLTKESEEKVLKKESMWLVRKTQTAMYCYLDKKNTLTLYEPNFFS